MTGDNQPVRVLQCPKCGAGVEAGGEGDVISCGYCGASLQVATGASGNLIARMSSIDASTAFVARTKERSRLVVQVGWIDKELEGFRDYKSPLHEWRKSVNCLRNRVEQHNE